MKDCKIHIIGSGPYGLGIANTLYENGIDFQITGNPLTLWYEHTLDTMSIRSDYHTSEIFSPSKKFDIVKYLYKTYPDRAKEILQKRIPIDIFRAYLKYVEEILPFNINIGQVKELNSSNGSYISILENGDTIKSDKVIVATGIGRHKYLPSSLNGLKNVYHGWDVKEFTNFRGKEILVIGAGQSAGESIVHLQPSNSMTWLIRKRPIYYSEPINLPKWIFNILLRVSPYFYFLPDRVRLHFGKKYVIATITPDMKNLLESNKIDRIQSEIGDLELIMKDSKIYSKKYNKTYDAIIATTGYRYNIENLPFINSSIRSNINTKRGIPILSYDFESSVNNIYFVGGIAEPEYGPAQRFMMGAKHASLRMLKVAQNR